MRSALLLPLALVGSATGRSLAAQRASAAKQPIAFVGVNLVAMESEQVVPDQTVVVRGDRIVALGARALVNVPAGTITIDGSGRYLAPGLTDAHTHLAAQHGVRLDFGDAPLYLASGVTTVLNLRGNAHILDWRDRVKAGVLLGPTIYTSGEFVNEPRIVTPAEVEREVRDQARQGYDVLKYHEVLNSDGKGFSTTVGFSLPTYRRMIEVAREVGMPLIGHMPPGTIGGLDAVRQAHQNLAHVGILVGYFAAQPSKRHLISLVTGGSILLLLVMPWVGAFRRTPTFARVRRLGCWALVVAVVAVGAFVPLVPGGMYFDSSLLSVGFMTAALVLAGIAVAMTCLAIKLWRDPGATMAARVHGCLGSVAVLVLAYPIVGHGIPAAWRTSEHGIEAMAKDLRDAGVMVQSTLSVQDIIHCRYHSGCRSRLSTDPALDYLLAEVSEPYRTAAASRPSSPSILELLPFPRWLEFVERVTGILQRQGVVIMAGTDAMGFPLVLPGVSLRRELQLLVDAGLTPYQAIRAATVAPASFLRQANEFGTIAVGKRADLLLLDRNPLQSIAALEQPVGVMVRGTWLPQEELQRMMAVLAHKT